MVYRFICRVCGGEDFGTEKGEAKDNKPAS
jgi:hypothetical protein